LLGADVTECAQCHALLVDHLREAGVEVGVQVAVGGRERGLEPVDPVQQRREIGAQLPGRGVPLLQGAEQVGGQSIPDRVRRRRLRGPGPQPVCHLLDEAREVTATDVTHHSGDGRADDPAAERGCHDRGKR
jgi:hypothetical protein